MRYLLSTVSHPVMNLVLNIAEAKRLEKHKDHGPYMEKVRANRWKAIFLGRPYQKMFS